ncbi:tryptophan--tRNA ligase [Candidatus Marinamargulisbacteria bacterium SCGC AG-333-B06]|nr:tryptophan--tRNA ligase [Candidatus Marinamargulisbacteria bacterium SCGC AG-333-B06]
MPQTILTGIKPTGLPHIGNYFGAINPALSYADDYNSYLFIADYHALTTFRSAEDMSNHTRQIAAAWLALGLDPNKHVFYKQSDIPEIFELAWILSCFTPKGILNRAHAYKAAVQLNMDTNKDYDLNINTGVFNYPILMAADILLFHAHLIPVGADQKQHVEIARDIADYVTQKTGYPLTSPEPAINQTDLLVMGIDGQKMSKNYNNIIPIFVDEKQLRKICMQIVTDSTPVEEPKDPDMCYVYQIFKHFLSESEQKDLANRYQAGGLGYGTVKQDLFECIRDYFQDARDRYVSLMNDPSHIDRLLVSGKDKARSIASQTLTELKQKLGILV